MKSALFLTSFGLLISPVFAQSGLRQLIPTIGSIPDVSAQAQQRQERLYFLRDNGPSTAAEKAEMVKLSKTNK